MAGHRSILLWNRGWSAAGGPLGPLATSALRSHGRFQRGGADADHTGHVPVAEPTHWQLGWIEFQGRLGFLSGGALGKATKITIQKPKCAIPKPKLKRFRNQK